MNKILVRNFCAIIALTFIFAGGAIGRDVRRNAVCFQGSHTVANILGPWASEYDNVKNVSIVVYGSTHGKGLEALLNNQADVAMLGHKLSQNEKDEAARKGFSLEVVSLGLDAIPVIVHPSNPVNDLTLDQLRNIFSGRYTSWKDVGGADRPIELIALPADAGFSQYICKNVLKVDFGPNTQFISAITPAPKMVQSRESAISFCRHDIGIKEHQNNTLKMLKLKKDDASSAVMPLENAVSDGDYPIVRDLLVAYDPSKLSDNAKQFIEFCSKKSRTNQPLASVRNEN